MILLAVPTMAQQLVTRVVQLETVPPAQATHEWQPLQAPAGGWPVDLKALVQAIHVQAGAIVRIASIERRERKPDESGTTVTGDGDRFRAISVIDAATTPEIMFVRTGTELGPKVVKRVEPVYPDSARKARIGGLVILQVEVDEAGNVVFAHVIKGLPEGLSDAAVDAVRQWMFEPQTVDGKPVRVLFNTVINFMPR